MIIDGTSVAVDQGIVNLRLPLTIPEALMITQLEIYDHPKGFQVALKCFVGKKG